MNPLPYQEHFWRLGKRSINARIPLNFFAKIRSISPEKVVPVEELSDCQGSYHSNLNAHSQFAHRFFQEAFVDNDIFDIF
jgi:hypothetical protein